MKKVKLFIIVALFCLNQAQLKAQNVTIPDANFKTYLLGESLINTNGDSEIQVTEAHAFTGRVDCPNRSIVNLTGIEVFINITQLACYNNQLTSLDVSQNTKLTHLEVSDNQLVNLDASSSPSIIRLDCNNNQLGSIDVSQNTLMQVFYCNNNQLTSLDLSSNIVLDAFYCDSNPLLTSLNIKNGANTIMTTSIYLNNNPNLTCIEVDNVAYSTANWTNVDSSASFSTDCDAVSITKIGNTLDQVKFYPNPTTKFVQLDLGQLYETISIQVVTITGEVILEKTAEHRQTMALELEGAAGVYFVKIQTEEGETTAKILKE